jgi:maleylpyruvate isomerase
MAPELDRATARLMVTVGSMSPSSLAEPSLMPDWSRGHVLSHLSRNADALNNLMIWAATGVETPAYATPIARAEGIEAGAYRTLDEQAEDLRASCERLAASIAAMPAAAWPVLLGDQGPAAKVVWRRWREVEVHHVDLRLDYTPADWPAAFTLHLLNEVVSDRPRANGALPALGIKADELGHALQLGQGTPEVVVSGPAYELAAWLAGRSSGASLSVSGNAPLPTLSNWI